jgi:hypothetical protein
MLGIEKIVDKKLDLEPIKFDDTGKYGGRRALLPNSP